MDPHGDQQPPGSHPPPHAHHVRTQQPQQQQQPWQQQQQQQQTPGQYQPAQPPQQPQHRPQTSQSSSKSRGFSFSDRGRKNSHSHDKEALQETAAEKEANRLHSKADPTLAISEAEPAEIAAMEETSIAPLRSIVHKDSTGNPIVDPDKSNPTRSRWERPLDTIRGFEAAIDGAYHRKSMVRGADSDPAANWNRRGSYQQGPGQPRPRPDSFYGSRPVSMRPEGTSYDYNAAGPSRSSIYEGQSYGQGYGYPNAGGRQRPVRHQSEASNYSTYGRDQHGYQLAHKDRSYETVTSAAASGGSDPAGYHTDPTSSDNSSIERRSPNKRPEPVNDYGIGFSQPSNAPDHNFAAGVGSRAHHPLPPPPAAESYRPAQTSNVPRKEAPAVLRRQPTQQSTSSAAPDKRKSWFSRRFSKNS